MKVTNWITIALLNLVAGLFIISPFLPGPPNSAVNLFLNIGQILGVFGLIVIPVGLIWTIKEWKQRRNDRQHQININAIILLTLPLTISITSIYISRLMRDFSRNLAIDRTGELIRSIETFKEERGKYPDRLADLTPEFIADIPSPNIMGIYQYYYERHADTYTVSFAQNVLMGFNFEVVTFDPTDNHKAEGEHSEIYDTGKEHWKYYVFD